MSILHRTGVYQGNDPLLKGYRALIQIEHGNGKLLWANHRCKAQFTEVKGRFPDKIDGLPVGAEKYLFDWHDFWLGDFRLISEDE
jgi:hypothetical protein